MKKFGRYHHFTHVYQSTPSPPLKISKIKILKKMKKMHGDMEILSFYTYTPTIYQHHMMYTS